MAEIAHQVNDKTENIGARRLYTVLEKLLESISFQAERYSDQEVVVDVAWVERELDAVAGNEDLARYIL